MVLSCHAGNKNLGGLTGLFVEQTMSYWRADGIALSLRKAVWPIVALLVSFGIGFRQLSLSEGELPNI